MMGSHIRDIWDDHIKLTTNIQIYSTMLNVKMTLSSRHGVQVDGNCIDEKLEFNVYSKEYEHIINLIKKNKKGIVIMRCLMRQFNDELFTKYINKFYKLKGWTIIKCATLILSLHKRAVVTANHPDRLLQAGVFQDLE